MALEYLRYLPSQERAAAASFMSSSAPPALRINPFKASEDHVQGWADRYGWRIEPVAFCPQGWQVFSDDHTASRTLEYRMGQYYLQDAASMLPGQVYIPSADEPRVLDLCAAPGGKSTHLISKIQDRGLLIANDISAKRLPALIASLAGWGATHIAVTSLPGEQIGGALPERFDAVLVDAPCSGESLRFSRTPRLVSESEREALVDRQIRLLESALRAAKPGGVIIYATCTASPAENEGVIEAILRRYPDQISLRDLTLIDHPSARGLDLYDNPALTRCVRLWPHLFDTEAFFTAVLEKRDTLPSVPFAMAGDFEQSGVQPLADQAVQQAIRAFADLGCDLPSLLDTHGLSLWRRREHLFVLSDLLTSEFPSLPVRQAGLMLARETADDLVPSVEFVSRFEQHFTAPRLTLVKRELPVWLRGGDLRRDAGRAGKSLVLLEDADQRFVGLGKISSGRVRNLLPSHWFKNNSQIIG
jgi:16S rRNA (cytosine1407-C5)-methyltransferase